MKFEFELTKIPVDCDYEVAQSVINNLKTGDCCFVGKSVNDYVKKHDNREVGRL